MRHALAVPDDGLNASYLYCSVGSRHFISDWHLCERNSAELTLLYMYKLILVDIQKR